MNFLFLCTNYPLRSGETYLTGDLAEALIERGDHVDVALIDWNANDADGDDPWVIGQAGVRVLRVVPVAIRGYGTLVYRASKILLSDRRLARVLREKLDLSQYDAVIAWMPALTLRGAIRAVVEAGVRRRILFIWDFFPFHQREIGMIRSSLAFAVALRSERALVRQFSAIITTAAQNDSYLRAHFPLAPHVQVLNTPVWYKPRSTSPFVDRAATRARFRLPADRAIAIFGGQLTDGRGIEDLLAVARKSNDSRDGIDYLFVGSGRLADRVAQAAKAQENLHLRSAIGLEDYLVLAHACDVGMIATVPGVTSFSYPSKTIDYLRAGLPVAIAVEPGSDYAKQLVAAGVGIAVSFGDIEAYRSAISTLVLRDRRQQSACAESYLRDILDVEHTLAVLDRALGATTVKPAG